MAEEEEKKENTVEKSDLRKSLSKPLSKPIMKMPFKDDIEPLLEMPKNIGNTNSFDPKLGVIMSRIFRKNEAITRNWSGDFREGYNSHINHVNGGEVGDGLSVNAVKVFPYDMVELYLAGMDAQDADFTGRNFNSSIIDEEMLNSTIHYAGATFHDARILRDGNILPIKESSLIIEKRMNDIGVLRSVDVAKKPVLARNIRATALVSCLSAAGFYLGQEFEKKSSQALGEDEVIKICDTQSAADDNIIKAICEKHNLHMP